VELFKCPFNTAETYPLHGTSLQDHPLPYRGSTSGLCWGLMPCRIFFYGHHCTNSSSH